MQMSCGYQLVDVDFQNLKFERPFAFAYFYQNTDSIYLSTWYFLCNLSKLYTVTDDIKKQTNKNIQFLFGQYWNQFWPDLKAV